MVSLSEFIPQIALSAVEAPDDIIIDYTRSTIYDFCRRTNALKRNGLVDIWTGSQEYLFLTEPNEQVVRLINVSMVSYGRHVHLKPNDFIFNFPNELILFTTPTHDLRNGLSITYSAAPTPTACEVDDYIRDNFSDAITYGTLARLLMVSNVPWTNIELGIRFKSDYEKYVRDANIQIFTGGKMGSHKLRLERFV